MFRTAKRSPLLRPSRHGLARVACLLGAALAGHVRADLVTNGGFETGDFTAWAQFGDTSYTGVGTLSQSGAYAAYFGPITSTGGISQLLSTTAGTPLIVDFWYQALGSRNSFSADLGGVNLVSLTNDTAHTTWTEFTFTVNAPTDTPTLSFTFSNPPSYDYLDGVRVTTTPAPGPITLAALGALVAARRKR